MPSLAIVGAEHLQQANCARRNATAADPWALEWTKKQFRRQRCAFKVDSFKPGEQVVAWSPLRRLEGAASGPSVERALVPVSNTSPRPARGAHWWKKGRMPGTFLPICRPRDPSPT